MIAAKYLHKVPDPFSSFRVIAPRIIVDPLGASKHPIGQPLSRFDALGPNSPSRKPFLQVITHQEVADLVPLFHLFLSVFLPVVEPPPPLHVEIRHGPPRLDHMELQMHENFNSQLPHALLRVGVLLPAQEGQALEAGLRGRLS